VDRVGYTVKEVAEALALNIKTVYDACAKKEIPSIRIRGRIIIPKPAFDRLLRGDVA